MQNIKREIKICFKLKFHFLIWSFWDLDQVDILQLDGTAQLQHRPTRWTTRETGVLNLLQAG